MQIAPGRLWTHRLFAIVLLPLFTVVPLAHSQQEHQPQVPAATSAHPEAHDADPAANPARPTVANPASLTPPGYLQFEQGFLQANATPGGGPDSQFSLVQTMKLALNHRVMPFLSSQPYSRSSTAGLVSNDPGDLDLGVQVVLLDNDESHSYLPTFAVSFIQRVRSGTSADLDVGSYSRSALLLASGDLPLGLHYDVNALFNEQPGTGYDRTSLATHDVNRAQYGQTVSVTHNLTSKFALTGEVWRFSQPFDQGNAIGNLDALGYTVRKTLVLDAGFSKGLTGTSTRFETFAGFTYLLPYRLFGRKEGTH